MAARPELAEHGEEPLRLALVQRRVGLVEDDELRLLEEDAGELDELALADGQPADRRMHVDMEAKAGEQVAALGLHRPGRDDAEAWTARG